MYKEISGSHPWFRREYTVSVNNVAEHLLHLGIIATRVSLKIQNQICTGSPN